VPRRERLFRRRRRILPIVFSLVAGLIVGTGTYAGWKLIRTPPPPRVTLEVPPTLVVDPGSPPAIPLPAQGSFDLVSTDGGQLASLAPSAQAPIGSIVKVMDALVALQKMPLTAGADGPSYTIQASDVSDYYRVAAEGGSRLLVEVGEKFTERQMLLALLLPSADNLADTLGVWVAGSDAAFVAQLNTQAAALGMGQTHFADDSGISPQTVSSAQDLVELGQAAMADPTLASLVATQAAVMPDGKKVQNLDTNLGTVPGWLGIKTGSTTQAGGCLLFAAHHPAPVGSPEVQLVGAILGQQLSGANDGLGPTLQAAAASVDAAFAAYDTVDLSRVAPPALPGSVSSAWGSRAGLLATWAGGPAPVVVRKGTALSLSSSVLAHLPNPVTGGSVVGHVTGRLAGTTVGTWIVTATGDLGQPGWQWLLTH